MFLFDFQQANRPSIRKKEHKYASSINISEKDAEQQTTSRKILFHCMRINTCESQNNQMSIQLTVYNLQK